MSKENIPPILHEIQARSLLRKMKRVDSWFLSAYGMNLYRGCEHDCLYCDGRAEKYRVEGEFGKEVTVKVNAVELLKRELDPKRKRKPFRKGFIFLGGGVGDSYQPVEEKYRLTRQALELLNQKEFPIHILTKSDLVLRDIDLLEEINRKQPVIVSFSLSSADDEISRRFEPGAVSPTRRFTAAGKIKERGIATGVFLLPVIPFVTDVPEVMGPTLKKCREVGIDFLMFGGMTLKEGRQKEFFYRTLNRLNPELVPQYDCLYRGERWGNPSGEYYRHIQQTFNRLIQRFPIPERIPPRLYVDYLDIEDRVMVQLEHIDHYHRTRGKTSPYGYAAYSISQLKQPLSEMRGRLCTIKGVGPVTQNIILDIMDNGSSSYLEKLMNAN
jgi:DNA repair photolyase